MRALVQRVSQATVIVNAKVTGAIGKGLLVFLGIKVGDTSAQAEILSQKVLNLRLFADGEGKMNRSLLEDSAEMLVISQFTLYADTTKGNRPSYSEAAPAQVAQPLYQHFIDNCRRKGARVSTGVFQAHMEVQLTNDGPVTVMCFSEA